MLDLAIVAAQGASAEMDPTLAVGAVVVGSIGAVGLVAFFTWVVTKVAKQVSR